VLVTGLRQNGVRVIEMRTRPKRHTLSRWVRLLGQYARAGERCDAILVPEFCHKDVLLGAAIGAFQGTTVVFDPLVSKYETKVVDRADAGLYSTGAYTSRAIDRLSLSLPELVLADTETHAAHFRSFAVPGQRVRVVPVGYDDSLFRPAPPPADGPFRVLFYGSYVPLHGAVTIVRAAAVLCGATNMQFEMIGGGQTFDAAKCAASDLCADNITFTPRVAPEELPLRIARAHVCLGIFGTSAKVRRVVPNKVYQCMGVGRPVVTADTPAMREYFTGDDNVVLVPSGNADALAEALARLADDAPGRDEMGRRALRAVQKRFVPRVLAGELLAAIEGVGAGG